MTRTKNLLAVLLIVAVIVVAISSTAKAGDVIVVSGELQGVRTYYGEIEVSAYHPNEDSYTNNFKGQPLRELVGEIVAAPTGSELIGKHIVIVDGERELHRRVWDTGCKKGRIDLLVEDGGSMQNWGLRDCGIWIVEDEP